MPRSGPEAVADEENTDEDGDGEGYERGDGADGEEGAGCEFAAEDEDGHGDADEGVEPDCVDGSAGMVIYAFGDGG